MARLIYKPFGLVVGVFGGVKALIDRAGATGFAWLTGAWPGRREEP